MKANNVKEEAKVKAKGANVMVAVIAERFHGEGEQLWGGIRVDIAMLADLIDGAD